VTFAANSPTKILFTPRAEMIELCMTVSLLFWRHAQPKATLSAKACRSVPRLATCPSGGSVLVALCRRASIQRALSEKFLKLLALLFNKLTSGK
jgi:hypothetical protein